jgi:hypothetical protein
MYAGIGQQLSRILTPLSVSIADQYATVAQRSVRYGQRATDLAHEQIIGIRCRPDIWTRRDAMSMANTLQYVTNPRHVHTSVVKKSAPAIAPQCARRNVCHDVGRSGTGGSPFRLSIRVIVERPTR